MFLTSEEVRDLTGLMHYKRQVRWLAERGYKFEVAVSGMPKILRSHIEHKLGGGSLKNHKETELDFSDSRYFS